MGFRFSAAPMYEAAPPKTFSDRLATHDGQTMISAPQSVRLPVGGFCAVGGAHRFARNRCLYIECIKNLRVREPI